MGLIPVFDPIGRRNVGHALETAVLLELERRGAQRSYMRTADASYKSGGNQHFSRAGSGLNLSIGAKQGRVARVDRALAMAICARRQPQSMRATCAPSGNSGLYV